jgi:hypothetical protein
VVEGSRYEYGFVADDSRFLEEWLHAYPNGRKQTWFEREEGGFKFYDHFHGENRLIEQVTRPNALFLSTAAQHQHQQLAPIFMWFRRLQALNLRPTGRNRPFAAGASGPSLEYWLEHAGAGRLADGSVKQSVVQQSVVDNRLEKFQRLLREADVGIVDVKLEREDAPSKDLEPGFAVRPHVFFQHKTTADSAWLPLEQESNGTRTIARFAPGIIDALEVGSVLAVDELESSLHPLLAMRLVQLFNDPATNFRGAQLIFTTHDTNLIGNVLRQPLLRRDQVWLTEKDAEGATRLYPLTDYKPRKEENLERGYLQGRYGAIPFLGDLLPEEG